MHSDPHYFAIPSINSVYHGFEGISNVEPRTWGLVPDSLKELNSAALSKMKLKTHVRPISLALVFVIPCK